MPLTPDQHRVLRVTEYRARDLAREHIRAARRLYDAEQWPQACFLAMTAIEELGKSLEVQRVRAENDAEPFETLAERLRDHGEKALMGLFPALVMNDEARKRHGRHPETGRYRVDVVRTL